LAHLTHLIIDFRAISADAIDAFHLQANPNALVILSGLGYDTRIDFAGSMLTTGALPRFNFKLVMEAHVYSWSQSANFDTPEGCAAARDLWGQRFGFLLNQNQAYTVPVFLSEFGSWTTDNFIRCISGYLTGNEMGFAWWTIGASY
jgi:hypothetical protein